MLKHTTIGNGPPIVLLPSMLGSIDAEWRPYMQTIADMGYTVIAVDWPGHAQSDMTKSFTFRVLIEELDELFKVSPKREFSHRSRAEKQPSPTVLIFHNLEAAAL